MNNTEFLREFGKILMRPTTKSTALDLYEAYQGYCVNKFDRYRRLSARDKLPVAYLFEHVRDGRFSPSELRDDDLEAFHPEKDFQGQPMERREFQKYIDFLKLVANGVLQKFMHFGERCIEDCENLWRESEDNQGEPTRDDIYGFFEDDMWARLYEAWKDECDEWCDLIGEEKALEWFDEGARSWLEKRFSSALG